MEWALSGHIKIISVKYECSQQNGILVIITGCHGGNELSNNVVQLHRIIYLCDLFQSQNPW